MAVLGFYKTALGKQGIGLQVSDCQTRLPLKDTRRSTTALYQSTLFVPLCFPSFYPSLTSSSAFLDSVVVPKDELAQRP